MQLSNYTESIYINSYNVDMSICLHFCNPRRIKVNGTEYCCNCYVVYGYENLLPLFGKIEFIIVVSGEPLLILHCLKTTGFVEHIRCYLLDCDHVSCYHQAFHFSELVDYYPLHKHSTFSQIDYNLYICLKWNIENVHDNNVVL